MIQSKFWRRLLYFNLVVLVVLLAIRYRLEYRAVQASTPTSWTTDHQGDCAVALTGGPHRVREGVDLLYRGLVKHLIISGVNPTTTWHEMMPQWPFYGGLEEDKIVLERRSTTTYGNAIQTLPLVEALHCRNLVLITSSLHMHRAYQTFKSVFGDFPISQHSVAGGPVHPPFWDVALEAFKSVFYSTWAF